MIRAEQNDRSLLADALGVSPDIAIENGIPDHEDACPLKPGPATPDPTHSGCPTDKKRAAQEQQEAAPPAEQESPNAPATVKKRRAK